MFPTDAVHATPTLEVLVTAAVNCSFAEELRTADPGVRLTAMELPVLFDDEFPLLTPTQAVRERERPSTPKKLITFRLEAAGNASDLLIGYLSNGGSGGRLAGRPRGNSRDQEVPVPDTQWPIR